MFDILVYIFHKFFPFGTATELKELISELSDAGFERGEIARALIWFSDLRKKDIQMPPAYGAFRIYSVHEQKKLDVPCQDFLYMLENIGAIDATMREIIIDRAMDLDETDIPINRLKLIVLMVLWSRHATIDLLLMHELLNEQGDVLN